MKFDLGHSNSVLLALHAAITKNSLDRVQKFARYLRDHNDLDGVHLSKTALMRAAWHGHAECCAVLLDLDARHDCRGEFGNQAMHYAAASGSAACVRTMLEHQVPVAVVNDNGRTPLIWSAAMGKLESCQLLLDAGADVNWREADSKTALYCAVANNHVDVCRLLLDRGALINEPVNAAGIVVDIKTPLGAVIHILEDDPEWQPLAILLLERGATVLPQHLPVLADSCAEHFNPALARQLVQLGHESALHEATTNKSTATALRGWLGALAARRAAAAALETPAPAA